MTDKVCPAEAVVYAKVAKEYFVTWQAIAPKMLKAAAQSDPTLADKLPFVKQSVDAFNADYTTIQANVLASDYSGCLCFSEQLNIDRSSILERYAFIEMITPGATAETVSLAQTNYLAAAATSDAFMQEYLTCFDNIVTDVKDEF